jgi:pimeloyl-ACP methyl ester carboxylesterase
MRTRALRLALLVLFVLPLAAQTPARTPHVTFRVSLASEASAVPVSGRLIVFMSSKAKGDRLLAPEFGPGVRDIWITAKEVHDLKPGASVDVDPDELSYPAPFEKARTANYHLMALLDVDHNFVYLGHLSGGDLTSADVKELGFSPAEDRVVALTLSKRFTEKPVEASPHSELLDFVSPSLSAFWGRPIHMRGVVVLPPSYSPKSKQTWPTVYWTHGFTADLRAIAQSIAPAYYNSMEQRRSPEMIYVLLDESCPLGTHEFADSVNNGPWGNALTTELIPWLEAKYRMDAKPEGRFLNGHSSGGWAALWLQVKYPDFFGGSWPTAPDPPDFRSFTGPNLTTNPPQNMYRRPDGKPWMLMRIGKKDVESLEEFTRQEQVLGSYGGQMSSFEAVFSPRSTDGRPMQLFDRETGAVNPDVEKAWERYDIAQVLRENWSTLGPKLNGKIHLIVGTEDTFHLEESAHLLEETIKQLGGKPDFRYLPGRNHLDLYRGGLADQIAKEMYKVARPGVKFEFTAGH